MHSNNNDIGRIQNKLSGEIIGFLLIPIVIAFFFLTRRYLLLDVWNDEIYTLLHFVFVPVSQIVSDYHVPNNHILFSLILKGWSAIWGINSIDAAIQNTLILRILPFGFSFFALLVTIRTGIRFYGHASGLLVGIILLCTLPFLNFTTQLRGYSLSILLLSLLLHKYLAYRQSGTNRQLIWVGFLTLLALYSIPLNLYFILSLGFYTVIALYPSVIKKKPTSVIERNRLLRLAGALITGTTLALLAYLPVFNDVFFNNYVDSHGSDAAKGIDTFFRTMYYFIGGRYELLLVFLLPIFILVNKHKSEKLLLLPIILFLLPFLISLLRGDHAPLRAFIILLPVFALFLSSWMMQLIGIFTSSDWIKAIVVILVVGSSAFHLYQNHSRASWQIEKNLLNEVRQQDIFTAYYLYQYHPQKTIEEVLENVVDAENAPWIIHDSEPYGLPYFIESEGRNWYSMEAVDSLLKLGHKKLILFSTKPYSTLSSLETQYQTLHFHRADLSLAYHRVLLIEER